MKDTSEFRERFNRWKAGDKVYEAGKVLPKYDTGEPEDNSIYLPQYQYEIDVTPNGNYYQKHPVITNEADWQGYWGNVGAAAVNRTLEAVAPYVLNGMSMLMGNPVGAAAGIAGSLFGEEVGANFGPHGKTIGGLIGGLVLNPETLINLSKNVKLLYNFANHRFSNDILPVTGRPNTLRRFVGTGTSGLDDAIESGVIRGKTENPVPHTAHQLTKLNKKLHAANISDDVIRRFNSGELTESDWNTIAPVLNDVGGKAGSGIQLLKKKPLGDSFADYRKEIVNQRLANKLVQDRWDLYGPTDNWSGNWNGHNMATFAKYGETLSNKDIFPGDFAVEIQNADKWMRNATGYGHSAIHPVTYRPIEFNNPDVTWYERAFGLLDGEPYMRKIKDSSMNNAWLRYWDKLNTYDKGKSIHINPANRGKFNATKKRTGKTTEELTHSNNPLTRKRAIFAKNTKKFKH